MKSNLNKKVIVRFKDFKKEGIIKAEWLTRSANSPRLIMWYNVYHKDSVTVVTNKHLTFL